MEAIREFLFDNFEILFVLFGIITVFLVSLMLFLFKTNNIFSITNQILKSILNDSLDEFLESVTFTIRGTFDQSYEIKQGVNFLTRHLNTKTVKKIIQTFNSLGGSGRDEASVVFKRAFLCKKIDFWVETYVAYIYPAEDQETCQIIKELFGVIYQEEGRHEIWKLIYQRLALIENNPRSDPDSVDLLKKEGQRIHEMLRPEKVSPSPL